MSDLLSPYILWGKGGMRVWFGGPSGNLSAEKNQGPTNNVPTHSGLI